MGLDMYLVKRHYVKNWDFMSPNERHEITVKLGGVIVDYIKPERVSEIIEQVAYWRKANQIHDWFVKNVQDGKDECQYSSVSREQLQKLIATVEKVLADHSLAKELLPTTTTTAGFFFGGTEYDEGYWHDLKNTKTQIEALLAEPERGGEYYYHASW
jgi:hypothetical protein